MNNYSTDKNQIRAEIALAAARLIAENGTDYGTAKRKAAKQILENSKIPVDILPDNAQVESEVRLYNELFLSDSQPARLLTLRKLALHIMEELAQFSPYLTGAVLNGTAGAHSDIHLLLFTDNPKDVEIFLLNKNIQFEVSETPHFNRHSAPVETLSFMQENEGVHIAIYATDDIRRPARMSHERKIERADIFSVRTLFTTETEK